MWLKLIIMFKNDQKVSNMYRYDLTSIRYVQKCLKRSNIFKNDQKTKKLIKKIKYDQK